MHLFSQAFGVLATNSYLLVDSQSKQALWIDPAPGSEVWVDHVLPADFTITTILLTHSHWDHIAAIGHSHLALHAQLYVHPLDRGNLEDSGSDGLGWPQAVLKPVVRSASITLLAEGMTTFGPYSFEIIHTPGHSMGSCCFLSHTHNYLFCGDTLFASNFGRIDLPTSCPKLMRRSLCRLAQLPAELMVMPGHGQSSTLGGLAWLAHWKSVNGALES